jgi:hypothetical protein
MLVQSPEIADGMMPVLCHFGHRGAGSRVPKGGVELAFKYGMMSIFPLFPALL